MAEISTTPTEPKAAQGDNVRAAGGQQEVRPSFDELIKNEYREDFEAKIRDIVAKRFKAPRDKPDAPQQDRENGAAAELARQTQEAEQTYGKAFRFENEMKNPQFQRLIRSGASILEAFEAVHARDIISAGMRYSARRTREQMAGAITSGALRPAEAGTFSAAVSTVDPKSLTKAQRAELNTRARRGEKITPDMFR